jgi:hypothetical protein
MADDMLLVTSGYTLRVLDGHTGRQVWRINLSEPIRAVHTYNDQAYLLSGETI